MPTRRRRTDGKVLRPVHPNAGITAAYRKRILRLIDEMARSYAYWLRCCYRQNEPRVAALAMDATPSKELQDTLANLGRRWGKRIDATAPELAKWFGRSINRRSDAAMRRILRDGGFSVRFRMTGTMRDVLDATVGENVSLIKSIPQQYHDQVEGLVMRSVQQGRDLGSLTRELEKRFAITRRRAELIARDQNNKATASMTRVRQLEVGITEAVWLHSHGGKEPRPTHLANNGEPYDVAKGWFDPDPRVRRRIHPGELINCRCVSKPIVKGFS